jgi:hypothetical protein
MKLRLFAPIQGWLLAQALAGLLRVVLLLKLARTLAPRADHFVGLAPSV